MSAQGEHLSNSDLAKIFHTIADLLEIKGENIYKVLAYRRAADSLANLGGDAYEVWQAGELNQIPGVGKAIAEKLDELFRTGRLGFYEKVKTEVPVSLVDLLQVPDVGPKKAALFWGKAGVTSLPELEAAAREGKLRGLPGIGEKSEAKILAGIEALKRRSTRTPLGVAWPAAQELAAWLRNLPGVKAAEVAGSLRRMRSTVGDIDLVAAAADPKPVMEAFAHHSKVGQVLASGEAKTSVELKNTLRVQLWVHPPEQWGTVLQYATGSKEHSVHLRELAQDKKLSLSDHSIIQPDGQEVFYSEEAEVYAAIGLPWIPPEMREDRGEIQAALAGKLPRLIERGDLIAELHSHSTWSDGHSSIQAMAEAARERSLKVIAITDHSVSLGVARGLKIEDLQRQRVEIDAVQAKLGDSIRILQGTESEILADGSLDYPDEILAKLDVVIASLHSSLRQPRAVITERLLRAMRNPHVDIVGHPTGRLLPDREGADLDMDSVLKAAAETGIALEINAFPERLDLDDIYARRAAEMGIPLSINTDAHQPDHLDLVQFGVGVARRAWITPDQVINAWPTKRLLDWLKHRTKG